jgi:peptidoglycan hydrolase-like protein with peptidoglycan-binding domain
LDKIDMNIPSGLLREGSHGSRVKDLQRELAAKGFSPQGVDGDFGAHTKAAVEEFQRAHHLQVDGVVGARTWRALGGDRFERTPQSAQPPSAKKETSRLYGADTSHWQSDAEFQRSLNGAKYAALGATDGHGFVDPKFKQRWAEVGQRIKNGAMKLRIAYHFLEPGDGVGQAKHFLSTLGIHGKLPRGTRLALDWEAKALSSPQTLRAAAQDIHAVTGTWPLVYTSANEVGTAKQMVPSAPMWEAKWSHGLAVHGVPFVQYNNGPGFDRDVFNGSLAQLEKFAGW